MFDYIRQEWGVLKNAPLAFVGLLILGLGLGFSGGMLFRGQEVAEAEALVRLKDGQLDGAQKQLSEAQQQLKDRIDKVEKALSDQQLSAIKSSLKTEPGSVEISGPAKADPRVDQLKSAFKDSGWSVQLNQAASDSVIVNPLTKESGSAVEKALNNAGVGYETVKPAGNVSSQNTFKLKVFE